MGLQRGVDLGFQFFRYFFSCGGGSVWSCVYDCSLKIRWPGVLLRVGEEFSGVVGGLVYSSSSSRDLLLYPVLSGFGVSPEA